MKILNTGFDFNQFTEKLNRRSYRLIGLDYDGTLAPFQDDPSMAVPYPGVCEQLNKIIDNPLNRLVIISGRWTKSLIPLLNLKKRPEIWGSHGLERMKPDGTSETIPMTQKALKGLSDASDWLTSSELRLRPEKKPGCLALHWRGLDNKQIQNESAIAAAQLQDIAKSSGLVLHKFDGGMELRVPGRDKGDVMQTLISEMEENILTVYLGDDYTDEDAFRAIKGHGISVLVRSEFRETSADIWLKPPAEMLDFLSLFS